MWCWFRNAVALTAMILVATAAAGSQALRGDQRSQFGGTWVHLAEVGPGFTVPALVILAGDGTFTGAGGLMFGGLPDNPYRNSPVYGVWQRTGGMRIGATSLSHVYDAVTGVLTGYERHRASLRFSADFDRYRGTEFIETLSCPSPLTCPDPLDPAAEWIPNPNMPPTGFPVSGARVERLAAGPREP